jgi:hypothetical protein
MRLRLTGVRPGNPVLCDPDLEPRIALRRFAVAMLTPKELEKNADECLRLARIARESKEIHVWLALIEMGTEFRVIAQHLEGNTRPRLPSHPRRLRLPTDLVRRWSEKLAAMTRAVVK